MEYGTIDHALAVRVGVRALQHREDGVGDGGHRDRRRDGRVEVLRDLLRTRDHRPLDGPRARVALDRVARRLERLQLGERRPLRVDRQPAPVRQHAGRTRRPCRSRGSRRRACRRQLGEVLTQDVLAGATLRRAAGEHRRKPPDDLALLAVGARRSWSRTRSSSSARRAPSSPCRSCSAARSRCAPRPRSAGARRTGPPSCGARRRTAGAPVASTARSPARRAPRSRPPRPRPPTSQPPMVRPPRGISMPRP